MKVFISWSGKRSKKVAATLYEWLPFVINAVDPWMSTEEIRAGTRWLIELAEELDATSIGIICLTKSNQRAPWILFEAGAIGKRVREARVIPYLLDLTRDQVEAGPLSQFQGRQAHKEGTAAIMRSINDVLPAEERLKDDQLKRSFEKWWPDLEEVLNDLPDEEITQPPGRNQDAILAEVLDLVRSVARRIPVTGIRDIEEYVFHYDHGGELGLAGVIHLAVDYADGGLPGVAVNPNLDAFLRLRPRERARALQMAFETSGVLRDLIRVPYGAFRRRFLEAVVEAGQLTGQGRPMQYPPLGGGEQAAVHDEL